MELVWLKLVAGTPLTSLRMNRKWVPHSGERFSSPPLFSGAGCPAPTPSPHALPPSGAAGCSALAAGVVCCGSRAGGLPSAPVTGMRGGRGERGAGRRRRWGHVKSGFLFPSRHESVAPVPVLYVHVPPFQLGAQGMQDFAVERDAHEAVARLVGPFRRQNAFAAGPRHLRHPCLSTFLVAPVLGESELLPS